MSAEGTSSAYLIASIWNVSPWTKIHKEKKSVRHLGPPDSVKQLGPLGRALPHPRLRRA